MVGIVSVVRDGGFVVDCSPVRRHLRGYDIHEFLGGYRHPLELQLDRIGCRCC